MCSLDNIQNVRDTDLKGSRVLVRVDFNVPLKDGMVDDNTRIVESLPTINLISQKQAKKIILMSHCGRPDGVRNLKYSLKPVAVELQKLMNREIIFLNDCVGKEVEEACEKAPEGSVILLENLRFHPEEEGKIVTEEKRKIACEPEAVAEFRRKLSRLGDAYCNDAFGTAHRAHSSVVGVDVPIKCVGLLMEKEISFFNKALNSPERPFLAILGGAKIRDKIALIENLLDKVDCMIIGGGMAYTFLKVLYNMPIGNSLWDEEGSKIIHKIMNKAQEKNVQILLPKDFVISSKYGEDGIIESATFETGIKDGFEGLDCGPKSREDAAKLIKSAKTIIWNGPQGVSEMASFAAGSLAFVDAVAEATANGALSIVGGGDTAALVRRAGAVEKMSHISTGGGASLELLEGKILPAVKYLQKPKVQA